MLKHGFFDKRRRKFSPRSINARINYGIIYNCSVGGSKCSTELLAASTKYNSLDNLNDIFNLESLL